MRPDDPLDLQGQAQASRRADEAQKLARLRAADDFKWLMADERGRRIVWRLLEEAGVFRSSFNESSNVMAFSEGRRDIGLQLLARAASDPAAFAAMQREHQPTNDA